MTEGVSATLVADDNKPSVNVLLINKPLNNVQFKNPNQKDGLALTFIWDEAQLTMKWKEKQPLCFWRNPSQIPEPMRDRSIKYHHSKVWVKVDPKQENVSTFGCFAWLVLRERGKRWRSAKSGKVWKMKIGVKRENFSLFVNVAKLHRHCSFRD